MRKRFVVALKSSTDQGDQAFREYVRAHGVGWWHWLPNFWLLSNREGILSATQIRQALDKIYPGVHKLVLEFSDDGEDTWSGLGIKTEEKSMFKWLRETWKD